MRWQLHRNYENCKQQTGRAEKMKRLGTLFLTVVFLATVLMTGCGQKEAGGTEAEGTQTAGAETEGTQTAGAETAGAEAEGTEDKEPLSVVFYANGNFGDNAYFDGNKEGVLRAEKELGVKVKLIEGGSDQADYQPAIEALAVSGEYDIIVTLTGKTSDIVLELADKYPEQDFFVMDTTMAEVRPNIFNSMYNQCEGSFLAGAFAALVTTNTELEGVNPEKVIGFIGVMDSPTINDFYDGYEQGAHYIDSEIEVLKSYVGDAVNAPKAKGLAMAMYNSQNADIIFNVGASAGLGTLEAGNEVGKYTIGVDVNQNGLYPGSVLTSMLKTSGTGIYNAIELYQKGELEMGTSQLWGIKEACIGLATDELYEEYVPDSIKQEMEKITTALVNGEIEVKSELY